MAAGPAIFYNKSVEDLRTAHGRRRMASRAARRRRRATDVQRSAARAVNLNNYTANFGIGVPFDRNLLICVLYIFAQIANTILSSIDYLLTILNRHSIIILYKLYL